jgi:polyketide biosynthesis enoyl-CoA hydratase PksI
LARQLSQKPSLSLITLKDHLVSPLRKQLHKVIKQEAVMHKKTFHQREVKERIIDLFGQ